MTSIGKSIISFGLGLAVGAVATHFLWNKKKEEEFYDTLQKAIDDECENLRRMHSALEPFGPKKDTKDDQTIEPKGGNSVDHTPPPPLPEGVVMATDYDTYADAMRRTGTAMHVTPEDISDDPEEGKLFGDNDPYQIDRQDYVALPSKFEFLEFSYYTGCRTLTDENDEVVENPWPYIGEVLNEPKPDENGYVFIIAEREGVACEIKIYNCCYEPND